MVRVLSRLYVVVLPSLLLAGCGGDSAPAPMAPVAPAPAAPARVPVKVAAPKAAFKSAAQKTAASAAPETPALPPGTDPADVFEIMDEPPQYEIVADDAAAGDGNLFAVVAPPAGQNSSSFTIVAPRAAAGTARRSSVRLPQGFVALPEFGVADDGRPNRIRAEKDGAEMAYVPAGTTHLGTNDGPREASPEITVYTDAYYIDVAEVTLEQFAKFRTEQNAADKRIRSDVLNGEAPSTHPALGVDWGGARAYAHWAGKELPTEAQWERAGRGNGSFPHPWGHDRAIWPHARTPEEITAVMSYRGDVSPFGVYDLAGNAREWCLDWYSDRAYTDAAKSGSATLRNWPGPKSPSAPNLRVVKGGSPTWHLWHRAGVNMSHEVPTIGFRCVLNLDAAEPQSNGAKARGGR